MPGSVTDAISVSGVGDINGDGRDDVLVSGGVGATVAHLYFGSAIGVGANPDVTITLPASVVLPHSSVGLGDFSGDGIADFALATPTSAGFAGEAWVFFGRSAGASWPSAINLTLGGSCAADLCLVGTGAAGLMGSAMAAVDFNGDSVMDLAVSAPSTATAGNVFVVLGSTGFVSGSSFNLPGGVGTAPNGFQLAAPSGLQRFGQGLTSPGDTGGDTFGELVIGSSNIPTGSGRVDYVLGRAFPVASSGLQTIASSEIRAIATGAGGSFGERVSAVGDFNGDTRIDIAVRDATDVGEITIYFQAADGSFGASSVTVENDLGRPSGNYWGGSLGLGYHPWFGTVGDFDGDRLGDLLAGSKERNISSTGPRTAGACELILGSSTAGYDPSRSLDVQYAFQPSGTAEDRRVAAYVGDLNADGHSDIFCADPNSDVGHVIY
jgi:glycosylphosphatidylinositol phospholipase D